MVVCLVTGETARGAYVVRAAAVFMHVVIEGEEVSAKTCLPFFFLWFGCNCCCCRYRRLLSLISKVKVMLMAHTTYGLIFGFAIRELNFDPSSTGTRAGHVKGRTAFWKEPCAGMRRCHS